MSVADPALDAYCTRHSSPLAPIMASLEATTASDTRLPQMLTGALEAGFLRFLVRAVQARRVLEVGTFTGYSALAMAEALPEDGRLVTLDNDEDDTAIARRFWAESPHGKKIELRLGDAATTLESLAGPFDLAFIDADKENYARYWELILPMMRTGGLIAVDNVLWSGTVLDPQDDMARAIADFNESVAQDARVEAVMLPVRDGITLAWKR